LSNKLWNYNALTQEVFIMQLVANPVSLQHIPLSVEQFMSTDYEWLCEFPQKGIKEIDQLQWQENYFDHLLVDIREPHELPRLNSFCSSLALEWMELPLSNLENNIACLFGRNVVFVCQAGVRSLMAANIADEIKSGLSGVQSEGGSRWIGRKNLI